MSLFRGILLITLGTSLLAACGPASDPGPDGGEGEGPSWAGRELPEPVERPDFVLTDMHGEPFDFRRETAGSVALLFFGYTHCPDVCPVHLANIAAVLRDLPLEVDRHIEVIFVTTDPERDTPERLREWLGDLHPSFVGLRGSREEVIAVEEELGLPASVVDPDGAEGEYFVGHAAQVLAFSGDGLARVVYPWGTRQADWRRDLPRLVEETVPDSARVGGGR